MSVCNSLGWIPPAILPTYIFEPMVRMTMLTRNITSMTLGIIIVSILSAFTEYVYTSPLAFFILDISLSSRTYDFTTLIAVRSSCSTALRSSYFLNIVLK